MGRLRDPSGSVACDWKPEWRTCSQDRSRSARWMAAMSGAAHDPHRDRPQPPRNSGRRADGRGADLCRSRRSGEPTAARARTSQPAATARGPGLGTSRGRCDSSRCGTVGSIRVRPGCLLLRGQTSRRSRGASRDPSTGQPGRGGTGCMYSSARAVGTSAKRFPSTPVKIQRLAQSVKMPGVRVSDRGPWCWLYLLI